MNNQTHPCAQGHDNDGINNCPLCGHGQSKAENNKHLAPHLYH